MRELNTKDPNHLIYKGQQLSFEVQGGVNPENYNTRWIMLVVSKGKNIYRGNVDLLNNEMLESYKRQVCEKTLVHRDTVTRDFDQFIDALEEHVMDLRQHKGAAKTFQIPDQERADAVEFLKRPNLLSEIDALIGTAGVIGNEKIRLLLFLSCLSRKTNRPLHTIIQSRDNYLQRKMSELIPEEEKLEIGNISENALFFLGESELVGKVILVEGNKGNRKNLEPLLNLQQGSSIRKLTVKKNEFSDLTTVQRQVKGNPPLSISTRDETIFSSNNHFSLVIKENSDREHTEKVLVYQRRQAAGLVNEFQEMKVKAQLHDLQRSLETVGVINPFALDLNLPEQVRNKQLTNLQYLRLIETITFLKQFQRLKKVNTDTGEQYVETTIEDIEQANILLSEIFVHRCDTIARKSRIVLERVKAFLVFQKPNEPHFSLREVSLALKIPKTTLARYVKSWEAAGLIEFLESNNPHLYQLVNPNEFTELQANVESELTHNLQQLRIKVNQKPKRTKTKLVQLTR